MNIQTTIPDSWVLQQLQRAADYFHEQQHIAYLVGGSIRNILLQQPCTDWDIVTDADAPRLARRLADQLGGFYAHLHDKASRILVKHDGQEMTLDISPLQGDSIEADLRQRDFTINAIAAPLTTVVQHFTTGTTLQLIDPLHGIADITARRLKAVDEHVFEHDPLRLLRAMRFLTRYDLRLDGWTEGLLIRNASLLPLAAPERIHDELYTLLETDGATDRLHLLDNHGLFTTLMPEFIPARGMPQPGLHYWDVFEHSLASVAGLELLAATMQLPAQDIQHSSLEVPGQQSLATLQHLLLEAEQQGIVQQGFMTTPTMKLAALLHDIGKPPTYTVDEEGIIRFYGHPQVGVPLAQHIMNRLHASTRNRQLVQLVVANHMRPGQLSSDIVTMRATRRYFVELGPSGIHVALVSLADHLAMRGPEPLTDSWARHLATVCLLLTRYIRERHSILPPRLVQTEELMHRFNLQSGPLIGQLLETIAEAQAEGRVQSKADAFWLVEEKLSHL